ncbi:MAG: uroporphyrinogen-III synthase [Ectothiorhodospiraceae bacterium]|nr:uroporphyrinogen-III synthase [Ectothiorhodospiraceae bacterium]
MEDALTGLTIAVPESRQLDLFANMLEERGATTLRCPLVAIRDVSDQDAVLGWLDRFIAQPPDWLILLTGEGLYRLLACAERHQRLEQFKAALAHCRTLTRGPKPGRALRSIDLRPTQVAESPTSAGVILTLGTLQLGGKRVAVQLYGQEPNPALMEALERAGARAVDVVAPYEYVSDTEDPDVLVLIDALSHRQVDAIAFTSKAQVERLFAVAEAAGRSEALKEGLEKTLVAAVGPVIADTLTGYGVGTDLQPEKSYFMKPLVRELAQARQAGRFSRP